MYSEALFERILATKEAKRLVCGGLVSSYKESAW